MPLYDEMNVCLVALCVELYGKCKILAGFLFCADVDMRHVRGSGLICDEKGRYLPTRQYLIGTTEAFNVCQLS